MKLLFLIGNSAVGKMTVGQELCKITPLRLFHNHMMIEPVLEIFGDFRGDVIQKLRRVIFEEFASSDNYGMVFTFMWAFDMPSDWEYLESVKQIFGLPEEDIYYVELIAPQEIRLERNATDNRLKHKVESASMTVDGKNAGAKTKITLAENNAMWKEDPRVVTVTLGDTLLTDKFYKGRNFHALVCDLPYGVQHESRDGKSKVSLDKMMERRCFRGKRRSSPAHAWRFPSTPTPCRLPMPE